MSARAALAEGWDISEEEWDAYLTEKRALFGREFPGMAPLQQERLSRRASAPARCGSAPT